MHFGCGDSHNAAVTTRMAFNKWAQMPMEALTALEFSRYTTPYFETKRPHLALAIGISVSGELHVPLKAALKRKLAHIRWQSPAMQIQKRQIYRIWYWMFTVPAMDIPTRANYGNTDRSLPGGVEICCKEVGRSVTKTAARCAINLCWRQISAKP